MAGNHTVISHLQKPPLAFCRIRRTEWPCLGFWAGLTHADIAYKNEGANPSQMFAGQIQDSHTFTFAVRKRGQKAAHRTGWWALPTCLWNVLRIVILSGFNRATGRTGGLWWRGVLLSPSACGPICSRAAQKPRLPHRPLAGWGLRRMDFST